MLYKGSCDVRTFQLGLAGQVLAALPHVIVEGLVLDRARWIDNLQAIYPKASIRAIVGLAPFAHFSQFLFQSILKHGLKVSAGQNDHAAGVSELEFRRILGYLGEAKPVVENEPALALKKGKESHSGGFAEG